MIEFKDVKKVYADGTEALNNFSLKVDEGELVTLIGPSGCGKTTTMKMINRLIEPTAGSIYINDKNIDEYNIHELRWNIGYVLQEIALFPHLTIAENIAIVPEMKKWNRKKIRERSHELLEMVGLYPTTYQSRMPSELSGGEQQRIGVIRALAADPDIILMDEPFSALDPISKEQLQKDIRSLQKQIKKTIVFVTHDMDEAMALGDKVCLMREGQIVQVDTPQQLILNPKTQFVKDFIGERKSPWLTAVDVIADSTDIHTISVRRMKEFQYSKRGMYVIRDENGCFSGVLEEGVELTSPDVLPNDMALYKAVEIIQNSKQHIFPVVKDKELIGTLTYKEIVSFLKRNTKVENGVIQS